MRPGSASSQSRAASVTGRPLQVSAARMISPTLMPTFSPGDLPPRPSEPDTRRCAAPGAVAKLTAPDGTGKIAIRLSASVPAVSPPKSADKRAYFIQPRAAIETVRRAKATRSLGFDAEVSEQHCRSQRAHSGVAAATRVPAPGTLSSVSRPPRASTRSRSPISPEPGRGLAPPAPSSPTSTWRWPSAERTRMTLGMRPSTSRRWQGSRLPRNRRSPQVPHQGGGQPRPIRQPELGSARRVTQRPRRYLAQSALSGGCPWLVPGARAAPRRARPAIHIRPARKLRLVGCRPARRLSVTTFSAIATIRCCAPSCRPSLDSPSRPCRWRPGCAPLRLRTSAS